MFFKVKVTFKNLFSYARAQCMYSRDSIIQAPVIRKNLRERISTTLKCSDNPEIRIPAPEIIFGNQSLLTYVNV